MTTLVSIHGRALGYEAGTKALVSNGIQITRPCVDATVTVSAEVANVRTITIQLKDADGKDINYVETVEMIIFGTADRTSLATPAPSTGLAIGTDGALRAITAHALYMATSEADGDIDLTWTDTGTAAAHLGLRLPNGRIVMGSQALTNA